MSIFTGLFRSKDKPQNRTAGSSYSFFIGNSTAGKAVTERSAMQMTAVYSCVRILSEAVAGLPLHLYRYKEDGGKEKALDHPLHQLLHPLQTERQLHPVGLQQFLVPKNRIRIPICCDVSVGQQDHSPAGVQNHIQIMGSN